MAAVALFTCSCGGETADAVLIVQGETVSAIGEVAFEMGPQGSRPKLAVPGYVVIFRVDAILGGNPGKAGMAYRIDHDLNLEEIGPVDLALSDGELARSFGVEPDR